VLGPTGPLARIQNPVWIHLALEPTQKRRPGRCRVSRSVRKPGVQVVGRHAHPQRPPGRGRRRLHVPFPPPSRTAVSRATAALSLGSELFSAH
jgi:hypothetical protein